MITAEMAHFTPRQILGSRKFKRMPRVGDKLEWKGKNWLVSGVTGSYPGPTNVTVFICEI